MTTAPAARAATASTALALVSSLAALIAVCSVLPAVNLSVFAPMTLQTFGVLLAGAILGARRGALAVLLWILVGTI
ncbi:biotin transporter BioY, partial [Escherichia coli]|uniref:biotin transporter BioY n=1 Tax=Escherichia coli TaxID=562 RepID=UPI000FF7B6D6